MEADGIDIHGEHHWCSRTDYMLDRLPMIQCQPNNFAAITTSTQSNDVWLLNSGASVHVVNDRSLFIEYKDAKSSVGTCQDGTALEIIGRGIVQIEVVSTTDVVTVLQLNNVAYAPKARCNLLSCALLACAGRISGI